MRGNIYKTKSAEKLPLCILSSANHAPKDTAFYCIYLQEKSNTSLPARFLEDTFRKPPLPTGYTNPPTYSRPYTPSYLDAPGILTMIQR